MMKTAIAAALLAATIAQPGVAQTPKASAPAPLKLERVVMMMRHGIRPPTKPAPVPASVSREQWPGWPVDFGLLTPRGAAGVKLLGESDRSWFAARGLFGRGCPAPGSVVLKASSKQRAIRTAESWSEGFMPSCSITVSHPSETGPDPIFHGLDDNPAWFDGQAAYRAALARAPKGGLAADVARYRADLTLLARVLNCALPACPLLREPTELVASPHDRPELEGPADIGSTASQTFLLQYLEGMPMRDVGWGRITRAQIEQLLRFHPLKFRYSNRPDPISRVAAAPIAREILAAFEDRRGARLTLLAGHDTNIADLAGFMRVHWKVPSYPADDVPPGSAMGFELLRDAKGSRYVRVFYRAQTMDQLRNQRRLTQNEAPFRQYLPLPGCGNSIAPRTCTLSAFAKLVRGRALPR
ncbi:MAG: histidine-type phosphatase [Sphingomonadales bacterium]|nr:MAG: histidine-type phosphatase [Sphingomonadales bacterium]